MQSWTWMRRQMGGSETRSVILNWKIVLLATSAFPLGFLIGFGVAAAVIPHCS